MPVIKVVGKYYSHEMRSNSKQLSGAARCKSRAEDGFEGKCELLKLGFVGGDILERSSTNPKYLE